MLPETKEEAHYINPTDKTLNFQKLVVKIQTLQSVGLASLLAGFGLYGTKRRKR
ncbi:MAG: hypothetical protein ACLS9T_10260 [Streptococcus salivarius]